MPAAGMITIAECQAMAARRRAQAETTPWRSAHLTASANRWAVLASWLQDMDDGHARLLQTLLQPMAVVFPTHRGFEYSVVQMADSSDWQWTCHMAGMDAETGRDSTESRAVKAVQAAIDQTIDLLLDVQSALTALGIDGVRELVVEIEAAIKKTLH